MKLTDLTLRKALELAATIEETAAQRYEALAEKFSGDETLATVFSQLAQDEAAHGSHFTDLARGCRTRPPSRTRRRLSIFSGPPRPRRS
jgi:rubrerythrin